MHRFSLAEAKARLAELIDLAAQGEEIVILRDGQPLARLTAGSDVAGRLSRLEAIERLRTFPRAELGPGETIKGLINEGRKY